MQRIAARAGVVGAMVALVGLGGAASSSAEEGAAGGARARAAGGGGSTAVEQSLCGTPGQPACPMQRWMRANIAAPLADNDAAALAVGLEKAAKLSPDPAWISWSTLALNGAAAAKKGDIAGARAACKGCHDAWREAYRAKYRLRAIPR